jgi:hypothetical protein
MDFPDRFNDIFVRLDGIHISRGCRTFIYFSSNIFSQLSKIYIRNYHFFSQITCLGFTKKMFFFWAKVR